MRSQSICNPSLQIGFPIESHKPAPTGKVLGRETRTGGHPMLTIYARAMLTAARQDCTQVHDLPPARKGGKRRWLRRKRCLDLTRL